MGLGLGFGLAAALTTCSRKAVANAAGEAKPCIAAMAVRLG